MTSFDIADYSYSRKRAAAAVAQSRHFTIKLRGQAIGIPVDCVKTIFHLDNLTRVPLAPREVAGLTNLRGRIVTALYLDRCLWLDAAAEGEHTLAVGVEHGGEEYALLVDGAEDVVASNEADRIACPGHIDPRLSEMMAGCYRYNDEFLSILDVDAMLRRVAKLSEAALRNARPAKSNKGANS
ncbi:chemotaxis protein CheW [Methylocystis parvus]|uniref:Chemotaxis protein CheW n=1 Tax=Methylocystis parvus TaxID=134 RepID=A0A6B8M5F0_9HYPH|nr:chemotaxis protein CheW [Methylocystis parvus]QGM98161.1 chemotaxis protein CheW [Methylocystis parvus]WBK01517.1 chemotaxis protein CheW [Methylocystis parvus OBBP]